MWTGATALVFGIGTAIAAVPVGFLLIGLAAAAAPTAAGVGVAVAVMTAAGLLLSGIALAAIGVIAYWAAVCGKLVKEQLERDAPAARAAPTDAPSPDRWRHRGGA